MTPLVAADGTPLRRLANAYTTTTAFRGADRLSQEMGGFLPPLRAAAAELHPERDALVARNRDLIRNNGFAAGIETELLESVIGSNWRLSAKPNWRALGLTYRQAIEWAARVEALWKAYADDPGCWIDASRKLRFAGLLRAQFATWFGTGEHLAVPVWLPDRVGPGRAQCATAIRLIDPDRLSNPSGSPESARLRGGIALGDHGEPLGYWIRNAHPNDYVLAIEAMTWTFVPRETEWGRPTCLHGGDFKRADQHRAPPPMSSVLEALRMQDVYERGEASAAILNAIFAAVLQLPLHGDPEFAEEMLTGKKKDGTALESGTADVNLSGLRIPQLPPGVELKFLNAARPVAPAFAQFEESVLRRISAGIGLSYEQVARDYSKTNYSSARASLLQAWKFLTGRSEFMASTFADHLYALWLEEQIDQGVIELPAGAPDFYTARSAWTQSRWIGPGRGLIDPTKERQASQMGIDIGLSTLEEEVASEGKDWNDILEQRAYEMERMRELGMRSEQGQVVYGLDTRNRDDKPGSGAGANGGS